MARYEDYKTDDLGNEITDASANQQARDEKGRFIPDRFQGKGIGDVIQSFEELEKLNSRQANDLGDMRRTVDQLLEMQTSSPAPEPTAVPVTAEDLYEDPDAAMRRVAREESSNEIKDLKDELSQMRLERRYNALEDKYPEWQRHSNSPEFSTWANGSPYRTRIATDAAQGDFDAAEEILGMYYESEVQADTTDDIPVDQTANLRDAMLETSSPAQTELVDTYSRSELMELRIASRKGDLRAERWLAAHSSSISDAYAEGRIVD